MKILITETHHSLLRRLGRIEDNIRPSLVVTDPCEYSRYEQYRREVLNRSIQMMLHDEDNNSFDNLSAKDIFELRDQIIPLFDKMIRNHYDNTDCSEDSEIMSESLWFRRRGIQLDDSENMSLMKNIIAEGFDYTEVCDYDYDGGFKDFLHEILEGSSVTFVNSFPEFTKLDDPRISHIDNQIYSFMLDKFGSLIEEAYHDRLELCDED